MRWLSWQDCAVKILAIIKLVHCDYSFVSYDHGYVALDNTNPVFISSVPVDGQKHVPVDSIIQITFSEKVIKGMGEIVLSCPIDTRSIPITDSQVVVDKSTNRSLLLQPAVRLRRQAVYDIILPPGLVMDYGGNNLQGGRFQFSTAGQARNLLVFAPFIQAPDSAVVTAFRTGDHCLYGSTEDEYRLTLWPSTLSVFRVPPDAMEENCARVTEVSDDFPALESCHVREGRFEVVLRQALHSVTEYSFVVQWPVQAGSNETAVTWNLLITRTYSGNLVEVERLEPFLHNFGDYLFNSLDDSRGAVTNFSIVPAATAGTSDWLGPEDTMEFIVHLRFSSPGLQPSSRILLFATPLMLWSVNPALPLNMTTLQLLSLLDPRHLSDPLSRGLPCLHVLPTDLPFATQCRNLELGLSGYSYGLELQLPVQSLGTEGTSEITFRISLPGTPQSLSLISRWEAILQHATAAGTPGSHSSRKQSSMPVVLNATRGMSLQVVSSEYPYPAPVGTRVNRVELEFSTGLYTLGALEVYIELLEPSKARFELCEAVAGAPQLVATQPSITDEPRSRVTWVLRPYGASGGPDRVVAYPRMRYRTSCLLYNGPYSSPLSYWLLGLVLQDPAGQPQQFSQIFESTSYFVATTLTAAQVTPSMPLLGQQQELFVRVLLPIDDGIMLSHWTAPARQLWLTAPSGFDLPLGPCLGFKPLTSSSMPPIPLTRCTARPHSQVFVISIDSTQPGFEPAHTYAFRVTVGNPLQWEEVQSRSIGGATVAGANQWSIRIMRDDGHPLLLLEDVPPVFSDYTASLRPELHPSEHDTSFRIYQRMMTIHDLRAEDSRVGQTTRVWLRLSLSTPLRLSDRLQITAPSSFKWVLEKLEKGPQTLQGTLPFPGGSVEAGSAAWIARVILAGEASAATLYSLVLNMTNPAEWSMLDQELNFWTLETFYEYGGILDKRSRRDMAVVQGYLLTGKLMHCNAVPLSRTQGESTWVSLTLKLGIPIFTHRFSLLPGPSQLHVRLPSGYHFAVLPQGTNCTGLLHAETFSDSPKLPTARFPHGYSPLADLSGFECAFDGDRLETSRTLVITPVQQENFGLLPHLLYAFRVHVLNPTYDRIFDTQWTFKSVGREDGVIYEDCTVDSLPTLAPALASLVAVRSHAGNTGGLPLPMQQVAVTFEFPSGSPITASPGAKNLAVLAPPDFVFLRHRLAVVEENSLDSGAWVLLSRDGNGAQANLQLHLNRSGSPLILTVFARVPSQPLEGVLASWSISMLDGHSGYQTAGLVSPAMRVMQQFTIQPVGIPFFRVRSNGQQAVVTLSPSTQVSAGGLVEVRGPRHDSFSFDADRPCEVLLEDPEVLGVSALQPDAGVSADSCSGLGGGSSSWLSPCRWPLASSCVVSLGGTRLSLRVWEALQPGQVYCFQVRIIGPPGLAGPMPPVSSVLRGTNGRTEDLLPVTSGNADSATGTTVPFVRDVRHLSLCYLSRAPGTAPRELTIRFVPNGMGISSSTAALEGQICIDGAALVHTATTVCRIYEPTASDLSCELLLSSDCRGVCVALRGSAFWAAPQQVVLSLWVQMQPRIVPRVDLQLLDVVTRSVVQGSTSSLDLPVLDELLGLTFSAPLTASTAAPFLVRLHVDWASLGAAFLQNLVETEEEELAFLDVSAPLGLRLSLSCQPVACRHIPPAAGSLRHSLRLLLDEQAPEAWWRRLQPQGLLPEEASGHTCSSTTTSSASRGSRSLQTTPFFNASRLPSEILLYATTSIPLTPMAFDNVWDFVLRSRALRALGAVELLGFGVAAQMDVRLAVSSHVAGDVFSRLSVTLMLQAPLEGGDVIVLLPPSLDIPCRTESVEPVDLIGPSTASIPHVQHGSCLLQLRQPLRTAIRYSFSMPLQNPAETPQPNVWLVQTFSQAGSVQSDGALWQTHSVATTPGFEVFGEFTFFNVLPKSSAPEVFAPAVLHFQLRTPFPTLAEAEAYPGFRGPPVRLRVAALNGSDLAQFPSFDPSQCLLDVYRDDVLVEPVADAEVLLPDDCLVTDGGATAEFLFHGIAWARQPQALWTRLRNPSFEAVSRASLTYEASTLLQGSPNVIHRTATRPVPPWGVRAEVNPGSLAAGVLHRTTITVIAGKAILGQRGALEVTLPLGFVGSCSSDHFRPRPTLPETARCSAYGPSDSRGGLIIVHWRTLFRTGGLRPPYEFSFALQNPNSTSAVDGVGGAWHFRIFEGENRELLVDGTPPAGLRPFQLCPVLTMSHRREDPRIISVLFNATEDLPETFDNLIRVELRSSVRAPASLTCPDTSIWQRRPEVLGAVQGLPRYTVCVAEPPQRTLSTYENSAQQYLSTVLFLLPFERFHAQEPYGLEVVMNRIPQVGQLGLSQSEAAAELLGLHLESQGMPRQCAAAPLGNVSWLLGV